MWHTITVLIQWGVVGLCCWHLILVSRRLLEAVELLRDCRMLLRLIFVGRDHKDITGLMKKK